jgi:RNA polymerase sigma-70 factor (ECF subfamily)
MDEQDRLAQRFETHRDHLGAVAYRMLGSLGEADDAVQEAWLRLSRSDTSAVDNLAGWLTTVVARLCLDMLRSRAARREHPVGSRLPERAEPFGTGVGDTDPAHEAQQADAAGRALLVVLDRLAPAERVVVVLHDVFAVPFDEVAAVLGATPAAARQLASRARKAVAEGDPKHTADLPEQRRVLSAFLDAATSGDLHGLLAVLAPDVIATGDGGGVVPAGAKSVVGATQVARFMVSGLRRVEKEATYLVAEPVLVNGSLGLLVDTEFLGQPIRLVMAFAVADGRVTGIFDQLNPAKLTRLPETARGGWPPRL